MLSYGTSLKCRDGLYFPLYDVDLIFYMILVVNMTLFSSTQIIIFILYICIMIKLRINF
jgi:hypothetical protein